MGISFYVILLLTSGIFGSQAGAEQQQQQEASHDVKTQLLLDSLVKWTTLDNIDLHQLPIPESNTLNGEFVKEGWEVGVGTVPSELLEEHNRKVAALVQNSPVMVNAVDTLDEVMAIGYETMSDMMATNLLLKRPRLADDFASGNNSRFSLVTVVADEQLTGEYTSGAFYDTDKAWKADQYSLASAEAVFPLVSKIFGIPVERFAEVFDVGDVHFEWQSASVQELDDDPLEFIKCSIMDDAKQMNLKEARLLGWKLLSSELVNTAATIHHQQNENAGRIRRSVKRGLKKKPYKATRGWNLTREIEQVFQILTGNRNYRHIFEDLRKLSSAKHKLPPSIRVKREVAANHGRRNSVVSRFLCVNATSGQPISHIPELVEILKELDRKNELSEYHQKFVKELHAKTNHSNPVVHVPLPGEPGFQCILYKINERMMEDNVKMLFTKLSDTFSTTTPMPTKDSLEPPASASEETETESPPENELHDGLNNQTAPVTSYQYVCVWQKLIDSTVVQSLADLLHTMKMNPDAIAVLETLDEDVLRNEAIFLIKTPEPYVADSDQFCALVVLDDQYIVDDVLEEMLAAINMTLVSNEVDQMANSTPFIPTAEMCAEVGEIMNVVHTDMLTLKTAVNNMPAADRDQIWSLYANVSHQTACDKENLTLMLCGHNLGLAFFENLQLWSVVDSQLNGSVNFWNNFEEFPIHLANSTAVSDFFGAIDRACASPNLTYPEAMSMFDHLHSLLYVITQLDEENMFPVDEIDKFKLTFQAYLQPSNSTVAAQLMTEFIISFTINPMKWCHLTEHTAEEMVSWIAELIDVGMELQVPDMPPLLSAVPDTSMEESVWTPIAVHLNGTMPFVDYELDAVSAKGSFIGTMRRAKLNFTGTSDEVDEQLSKFEKQSFFSKPVQMFGAPMPNPNMTVEVDVVRGQQFYTKDTATAAAKSLAVVINGTGEDVKQSMAELFVSLNENMSVEQEDDEMATPEAPVGILIWSLQQIRRKIYHANHVNPTLMFNVTFEGTFVGDYNIVADKVGEIVADMNAQVDHFLEGKFDVSPGEAGYVYLANVEHLTNLATNSYRNATHEVTTATNNAWSYKVLLVSGPTSEAIDEAPTMFAQGAMPVHETVHTGKTTRYELGHRVDSTWSRRKMTAQTIIVK